MNQPSVGSGTEIGATSEAVISTKAQLSEVTAVEPLNVSAPLPKEQLREKLVGFPDQTPIGVLGRRRLLVATSIAAPGVNPTIQKIDLWTSIKLNTNLQSYLKLFKGIRADIKITVLNRAAPGHYGYYTVGYTYGTPLVDQSNLLSMETWTCDIATSEGCEFTIPYRYPYDYLKTTTAGLGNDDNYVSLYLAYWGGAALDGGSTTLDLQIFFSLDDITVGLFTSDNIAHPQSKREMPGSSFGFRDFAEATADAATVGYAAYTAFTRPPDMDRPQTVRDEGQKVHKQSGKSTGVRQAFYGDLATITDETQMPSLTEEPVPKRLPCTGYYNMATDMSFKEIGKIPGLLSASSVSSTSPIGTILNYQFGLGGNNFNFGIWSWASYYARYFRFYRGDHVISLQFFTSPLVSARFRVSFQYLNANSTTVVGLDPMTEELPNEVFLVKGTTRKMFRIPFNSAYQMWPCAAVNIVAIVDMLDAPTKATVNDSKVFILAMHSIDNLEFASIQHGHSTDPTTPPPAVERGTKITARLQSNMRALHAEGDKGECTGQVLPSRAHLPIVNSVVDLMRRFDTSLIEDGTLPYVVQGLNALFWPGAGSTQDYYTNVANVIQASLPFAFVSGSIENRCIFDPGSLTGKQPRSASVSNTYQPVINRVADGVAATEILGWPYLDFRTPYIAGLQFISRHEFDERPGEAELVGINLNVANLDEVYIRAGPDFAVMYPNVLPTSATGISWQRAAAVV